MSEIRNVWERGVWEGALSGGSSQQRGSLAPHCPAERKSILAIWLPCWPIQRLVAANDALRRQPVILYRHLAQRGQIVSAVSPAAQVAGARIGMPLSEARSLLRRSHRGDATLRVMEHERAPDASELTALAIASQCFSPLVGLVTTRESPPAPSSIEEVPAGLWLDATTVLHLFGGAVGLVAAVGQFFQQRGYLVRQALAETPGKAWALARFGEQAAASHAPAPHANSPKATSPTETLSLTHPAPEVFDRLPVAALRLPAEVLENLRELGVQRIQQLRQLPRRGLLSRFGEALTRRLDQFDGVVSEPIEAIHAPPDYVTTETLDYPVSDRETVLVVIARLAERLCREMRSAQRGGLAWQCRLASADGASLVLSINVFQPTASESHLMPLVAMQLEDLLQAAHRKAFRRSDRSDKCTDEAGKREPDAAVTGGGGAGQGKTRQKAMLQLSVVDFELSVRNCVLLAERQRELFDEHPRRNTLALSQLINRLASRLGTAHVVRPCLRQGAMAEDAVGFEPLVGGGRLGGGKRSGGNGRTMATAISPLQRPLVLFPQARSIEVVSLDGRPQSGMNLPAVLRSPALAPALAPEKEANSRKGLAQQTRGETLARVQRRWGPERVETAWWRGPVVRRDYWRVETTDARWLWIYRDLKTGRWYWHGEFG